MIECLDVSVSYPAGGLTDDGKLMNDGKRTDDGKLTTDGKRTGGALKHISCKIEEGTFVLLCGPSGCGKTTMTRLFNGLIPHYHEGCYEGSVCLDGKDTRKLSLFDISGKVGSVFQNPRSQFFNVDTTSELAFGPENHGLPEAVVRQRVHEVSERLNLTRLLDRSIFSLSGGEKQKLACGSAASVEPKIYVLDEPSSNLDVFAIAELRQLLAALKAEGKTIVISEHRLYYLSGLIDRVLYLQDGEIKQDYTAETFCGLPTRQREEMGLRPLGLDDLNGTAVLQKKSAAGMWTIRDFSFAYRHAPEILHISRADFPAGCATAVIGTNGAGKSTFSRCLCGLEKRCRGMVQYQEASYSAKDRLKLCYMVMQDVNHQLFTESVLEEIMLSMESENREKAEELLAAMDLMPYRDRHPMGLSGGQKQRVAVASAIASDRPIVLLDEPTSGLDLFHMRQVAKEVNRLTGAGKTAVVVTHDPEFILRCCHYVFHMENGQIQEQYSLTDCEGQKRLLKFFKKEYFWKNDT